MYIPTSLCHSGVVLTAAADKSLSGVSLKTIAPESGDKSRTSSVSIESLVARHPAAWRHRASADLDRDLSHALPSCRLAFVDHTSPAVPTS